jgi:hypothetical protein
MRQKHEATNLLAALGSTIVPGKEIAPITKTAANCSE